MINKVTLLGNLGTDVEVVHFENGGKIAKCSLATSETWKDKATGEKREQTTWHNLIFQGNLVSLAEKYLEKGSKIYCEGKIHNRTYEVDGQKRYATEIYVRDLRFLSSKSQQTVSSSAGENDDVPF